MPTVPVRKTLTSTSAEILNVIRNNASVNYQNYVPVATMDGNTIREIGAVIMDYPTLQNEFLSALINRIGRVIITSKMYENPWAMFKKGVLDFGETIEDIFVNIATVNNFNPEDAESTVFARTTPDVRSAFYVMNYQKHYDVTVQQDDLRKAFLSIEGVTDLITKIIESLYTAANYDELQVMKYMLAKKLLRGQLFPKNVPTADSTNAKTIASVMKAVSNQLEFMSTNYNLAGVYNHTKKADQFLIVNADFDAIMDVEVLASAFNMSKAEFMGNRVLVDGFGKLDNARLGVIFAGDPNYTEITSAELTALDNIPCVLVDRSFFMIFDNKYEMTEIYNPKGLYWNYFYHTWKTFAVSPFANAIAFIPATPTVTAVTVTPETLTAMAGSTVTLSAEVSTTNFAPSSVNWSVLTDDDGIVESITNSGIVKIKADADSDSVAVIKATSTFNSAVSSSATITVA